MVTTLRDYARLVKVFIVQEGFHKIPLAEMRLIVSLLPWFEMLVWMSKTHPHLLAIKGFLNIPSLADAVITHLGPKKNDDGDDLSVPLIDRVVEWPPIMCPDLEASTFKADNLAIGSQPESPLLRILPHGLKSLRRLRVLSVPMTPKILTGLSLMRSLADLRLRLDSRAASGPDMDGLAIISADAFPSLRRIDIDGVSPPCTEFIEFFSTCAPIGCPNPQCVSDRQPGAN